MAKAAVAEKASEERYLKLNRYYSDGAEEWDEGDVVPFSVISARSTEPFEKYVKSLFGKEVDRAEWEASEKKRQERVKASYAARREMLKERRSDLAAKGVGMNLAERVALLEDKVEQLLSAKK